jgi:hypothetical protein
MERDDVVKDDFLKNLVSRVPLKSPSDDFTQKVMTGILAGPEPVKVKKPFYLFLKSWSPWILLGIFILVFLLSSDIPYLSFIPGKEYINDHILPYFSSLFAGMVRLYSDSKTVSITFALMVAGGLLYAVDWFVRRRSVARHHAA